MGSRTKDLTNNPERACGLCNEENNARMLECDECEAAFHLICVGFGPDEEVDGQADWLCSKCQADQSMYVPTQHELTQLHLHSKELQELALEASEKYKKEKAEADQLRKELAELKAGKIEAPKATPAPKINKAWEMHLADLEKTLNALRSDVSIRDDSSESSDGGEDEIFRGKEKKRGRSKSPVASTSISTLPTAMEQLVAFQSRQYCGTLPVFNGDINKWAEFKQKFERSTLHGMYSEYENINRLGESLTGQAKELVKDQLLSSRSASSIMNSLEKWYGRPDVLSERYVKDWLEHVPLKGSLDEKLISFASTAVTAVENLKSLNDPRLLSQPFVLTQVQNKLDNTGYYKRWARKLRENPTLNLEDFANFLMELTIELPPSVLLRHEASMKEVKTAKTKKVMAHVVSPSGQRAKRSCFHCSQDHGLWNCSAFKALEVCERWNVVRNKGICFACINSTDHRSPECPKKRTCNINGCVKEHNRLLHAGESPPGGRNVEQKTPLQPLAPDFVPGEPQVRRQNHHDNDDSVFYKVVPICVFDVNRQPVETFALLDGASGATLVDEAMFKRLGLEGSKELLTLQWTKSIKRQEETTRADIKIAALRGRKQFCLSNVFTVKDLNLPVQSRDVSDLRSRYPHLRGLPIGDLKNCQPTILIGLEHAQLLVETRAHQGGENDPVASKTPLGWIVWGRSTPELGIRNCNQTHHARQMCHISARSDDQDLHELVKDYFSTENFGVTPGKVALVGRKEQRAVDMMSGLMKFEGGRYEMPLLWANDDVMLPDSRPMAYKRLCMLEKKLLQDANLKTWMDDYIQGLIDKGYARVATDEDLNTRWPRTWYAPLFIVVNKNKVPPKPRVVADVAAQVQGVSLNSKLLKGPDNTAPLLAGLCKFRIEPVAVNLDVKEMFPQIVIRKEDQQCQRFLYRHCDLNAEPTTYVMERMMFGPTCSPTTAQFVKNHHANQYRHRYPAAVRALTETTYVDDYFNSHADVDEAFKVTTEAIEICSSMGFELVGAQSNSQDLIARLPPGNVKQAMVSLDPSSDTEYVTKVLGMYWKPQQDEFVFKSLSPLEVLALIDDSKGVTKREVLRTIMKTWDPLGLLSHFRIQGKIILQEIWKSGVEWDDNINEELQTKWRNHVSTLKDVEQLKIPRHYSPGVTDPSNLSLVIFTDASTEAYAATAYFRFEMNDGKVHVAQVLAKAKVAPIKPLTMPNLELQGAVMGKRIKQTICEMHPDMNISKFFMLSDSECVLQWIWSEHFKVKPFVAARVSEILDGTRPEDWYHVGTLDNVADDATRFRDVDVGNAASRWYQGPEFLLQPMETWPISQEKRKNVLHNKPVASIPIARGIWEDIKPHFKADWISLVNVTAFIRRGVQKLCKRPAVHPNFISAEEFERAELTLFRNIQKEAFPDEMRSLEKSPDGSQVSVSSKLIQFGPLMDEHGVMRMSTRSQAAMVSYAAKKPALLPNHHEIVDLMIMKYHQMNKHLGEDRTIADLRERVWIVQVRAALRRVVSRCQFCKLKNASPRMPLMGQLPLERVDFGVKAFTHVGLDCFGPISVKYGRGTVKRYGLIMTCLTYRAVHLELLMDMSLDQIMMAVQSLLALRGRVKTIRSDQGKNFVGAANQLESDGRALEAVFGRAVAARFRIEWTFLPAYSPWMGGAWERLIQSIKKSVYFTLQGETPREDVLRGALVQAEYEMNRRPLTHTPINHEDAPPLTPNTAMFGEDEDNKPALDVCAISPMAYRRVEHLSQKYMRRWLTEYLPEITRRSKWYLNVKPIALGDLVIVVEPNEARQDWRRGRVVAVHPGPDGVIRSADVMLSDKTIKKKRAVGRLAVLDVFVSSTESSDSPGNVVQPK